MAKTSGTILLKESRPKSTYEFFERIFSKSTARQEVASRLFNMIADGSINKPGFEENAKTLGVSVAIYYDMLKAMRARGIVYKRNGTWKLSGQFLTRLEDLIELYEEITKFKHKWRRE